MTKSRNKHKASNEFQPYFIDFAVWRQFFAAITKGETQLRSCKEELEVLRGKLAKSYCRPIHGAFKHQLLPVRQFVHAILDGIFRNELVCHNFVFLPESVSPLNGLRLDLGIPPWVQNKDLSGLLQVQAFTTSLTILGEQRWHIVRNVHQSQSPTKPH